MSSRRSLLRQRAMVSEIGVSLLQLHFKKIFDHRMGQWLQQMLEDVRKGRDHLTTWIQPKIKKALLVHRETDEVFRYQCLTN
ncbi:hypothetical protein Ahy_B05g075205 [Arachis hypogaea]|uniref:Uncharacterized protein n=1 Tax=Arachis hypogaea TaxID=3818 RepID=A0A444Z0Q1_ARAHY|nr:hypothetical protein Ahy_B05g075205 [Arachis hypogaea]